MTSQQMLIEDAFKARGLDPRDLDPHFIPYWMQQKKSVAEILEIAGLWPRGIGRA